MSDGSFGYYPTSSTPQPSVPLPQLPPKSRTSPRIVVRRILAELRECIAFQLSEDHCGDLEIDIGPRVDKVFYFPSVDYTLSLNYIWPWESMDLCQGKLPYYYKNVEVEEQKLRDEKMMLAYGAHTLRTSVSGVDNGGGGGGDGSAATGPPAVERASRAYQHLKYLFDTSELREEELGKAAAAATAADTPHDAHNTEGTADAAASSVAQSMEATPQPNLVTNPSIATDTSINLDNMYDHISAVPNHAQSPPITAAIAAEVPPSISQRNFLPAMKNAMMVHLPDGYSSNADSAAVAAQSTAFDDAYRLGMSMGLDMNGTCGSAAVSHSHPSATTGGHGYFQPESGNYHQQHESVVPATYPMYNNAVPGGSGMDSERHLAAAAALAAYPTQQHPAPAMSLLASVAGSSSPLAMEPPLSAGSPAVPHPVRRGKASRKLSADAGVEDEAGVPQVKEPRKRKANVTPGEGSRYLKAGYYCCDLCPYRVRACLRNLRGHLKCHEADAMYKCAFCSFSSNFPRSLKKHEVLHGQPLEDGGEPSAAHAATGAAPGTVSVQLPGVGQLQNAESLPDWARLVSGM